MNKQFIDVYLNVPLCSAYTYDPGETGGENPVGKRVTVDFNHRKMTAFVIRSYTADELSFGYPVKKVQKFQDAEPLFGEFQIRLAEWISGRYLCSPGEALSLMVPGGKREVNSLSLWDEADESASGTPHKLSDDQRKAVETVSGSEDSFFYLYGVTGSGKTEVYLTLAEKTLAEGRGVLYLVPEIALTHQLTEQVRRRFGSRVSVIHSRLTPAQKYTEWRKILRGETDFVIGARSAVFAPLERPGLIILDEEHESSYKSQTAPRYHARQVAMYIAKSRNAKLVMGSATPSVEAYAAMQSGSVVPLMLPHRVAGGHRPRFHVIDMRGRKTLLSSELIHAVRDTLSEGRQVILFLNRRGFSYSFRCRTCGFEFHCDYCSLPLTFHKKENCFICHCCGRIRPAVHECPECRSQDIGYAGIGTEKIEEEIRTIFPQYKTERVDRDTVGSGKELGRILSRFRSGETRILLGTQMIAKGLNFPGLKLVGIVTIDNILSIPDFRSAERAFALITQVAGRTGRYSDDGEVFIQTERGHHPALIHAVKGDAESFYREETEMRRIAGFPPFSRLIHIVVRSASAETASQAAAFLANRLRLSGVSDEELMGPSEAPVARVNGQYRFHCLIRSERPQRYADTVRDACGQTAKEFRDCRIDIDVDPLSIE